MSKKQEEVVTVEKDIKGEPKPPKKQSKADKIKELEEKLLRLQAEFQNYRRRQEMELQKSLKYSNQDLAEQLLPILDNFERAIGMDDDNLEDEVSRFLEGFKMIYCAFVKTLNEYEIKEIEAMGKTYDPHYHQALLTENIIDKPDEIILEVLQKGYLLKDKVLRPAMVRVNLKKEKENDKDE